MSIVISGVNNNDKITASDGTIDLLSGVTYSSEITVPSLKIGSNIQLGNAGIITATTFAGNISGTTGTFGDFVDVGNNIQLGNAGVATATTFVGNLTGNVNNTGNLLFQIGGSEKVRITSAGAVMINKTSSFGTVPLQVKGTSSGLGDGSQIFDIATTDGSTGTRLAFGVNEDNFGWIRSYESGVGGRDIVLAASDEKMRIKSDGKIGIGITNPQKNLHLYSSGVATLRIETSDSRGQAWDILSTNGAQNNTGTLSFRDESGSAYLEFGANEGSPQFIVRNGGSNNLLHIDNSGRVTKPYQPSFCARHQSGSGFSGDIIVLTRISTSWDVWNTGGHYSTSTGKFTAPVAGVYYFEGQLMTTGHSNGDNIQDMFSLESNRGRITYVRQRESYFSNSTNANGYYTNSLGSSVRLAAGDTVWLQRQSGHSWGYSNRYYSYFTGWLIG